MRIVFWGLVGAAGGIVAGVAMAYITHWQHPDDPAAFHAGLLSILFTLPIGFVYGLYYGTKRRV